MKVFYSRQIPASPDKVWAIVGQFDGLPAISTPTDKSEIEDGGFIRRLTNVGGAVLLERMKFFDDDAMVLKYEITETINAKLAYGVGYIGTVRVKPDGKGGTIYEYEGEFEPSPGTTPEQAEAAVNNFSNDCMGGVARLLGLLDQLP